MSDIERREAQAVCGYLYDPRVTELFDIARSASANLIIDPGEAHIAMKYDEYEILISVEIKRNG